MDKGISGVQAITPVITDIPVREVIVTNAKTPSTARVVTFANPILEILTVSTVLGAPAVDTGSHVQERMGQPVMTITNLPVITGSPINLVVVRITMNSFAMISHAGQDINALSLRDMMGDLN